MVLDHKRTQTSDAKWLCLENIYEKLNRPNYYDIGGTYVGEVSDYWFTYRTDNVGASFLIHIFILSHHDRPFKIALSYNSKVMAEKNNHMYLSESLNEYEFKKVHEHKITYVATYNYTVMDVKYMKNKKLCICVKVLGSDVWGPECHIVNQVKLFHDFSHLLESPICSDFVIESTDGHKFNVHKLILSAQSEVFNAMLKDNTTESQTNYLKLVDAYQSDLRCILEFFYTGSLSERPHNYVNLLILADKYDLKGLHELSQHHLSEQLTVDNALEILTVADMCNTYFLKSAAFKFIKSHPDVMKTDAWHLMNNVELVRELCKYMVDEK